MYGQSKNPLAYKQDLEENLFSDQELEKLQYWYLTKEQQTIVLLKQALADQDFEQIITLADQIYGHGGSFGFNKISMFGKKIEVAAVMKDRVLLSCLISSLKAYLQYLILTKTTT
jgi:HPt (histidine-containing phosphotransfer) domain-containing protein